MTQVVEQDRNPNDPPPFDPKQPSIPISYPLKTLEELKSRAYFDSFHYPFDKSSVPLNSNSGLANRPRILVLGNFITEWDEGRAICNELLLTKESAQLYAERLAELAVALGFDGWLLNIETNLDVDQIPNLKEFIDPLTTVLHSSLPNSLVIWYDAVTVSGKLSWQNQLNHNNKPFDICDGIFVNYKWKEEYLKLSADAAGYRKFDVYMGIDVFGRGTYGGGKWNTNVALDVLKKDAVSAAIFAPGWVYETNQPPDFETAQNRWWDLVKKSWGIVLNYPEVLPFFSNFDRPVLEYSEDPSPDIQVLVDFKEASYSEGANIRFKGTLEGKAHFTTRLFQGKLLLGDQPVKSDGNSLIGLSLDFDLNLKERTSVLFASSGSTLQTMNQFSSKFGKVIMPHRVLRPEAVPGWLIQESSISMSGYMLTEIHAVCYKQESKLNEASSGSDFYAVLGHISAKMPNQYNLAKDGFEHLSAPAAGADYIGMAAVQDFYVSDLQLPSGISSVKFIVQVCSIDGSSQKLEDSPSFQLDVKTK
ncbi:Glycoside hydrolase, family 85 [Dillenia turbinata]|uniref:mannosyl-glycoprotein endo-beta-N-acetylglucosaminidase n=1 Tax=Dillenia turbinata TaxID=194707 RepID=A0AAN8VGI7_9MAGN